MGSGSGSTGSWGSTGRDQAAFMAARIPSFTHFLSTYSPDLLPFKEIGPLTGASADVIKSLPHATTIVAVATDRGVVMAGDRRATAGNMIVKRDVEKVFRADEYSAIGTAGTASIAMEFIRLFSVELEHYEKMEGRALSLEGKANRLGKMIRDNLMLAMQGLAVIPLFAGFDDETGTGRIFSYDVAGGPYEEHRYHSIGSGSIFAKSSLKKLYADDMPVSDTILACVQALYDAADDDSATGGPDVSRRIFPVVATITADGFNRLSDDEATDYAEQVVASRLRSPDGPSAAVRTAS